jgi:hypothetical protein
MCAYPQTLRRSHLSMSAENSVRILLSLLGVFGAIFGPAWLPVVPMVLLSIRFRAWEVIALGLFVDLLWLPGLHFPIFLALSIALVWAFEPLRKELLLS